MSAEILRKAAALMRERAEMATPGPWEAYRRHDGRLREPDLIGVVCEDDGDTSPDVFEDSGCDIEDAEHIASWHPAVALAVADWLDREADLFERLETVRLEVSKKGFEMSWGESTQDQALAVARAYLGESA